jgi:eukaryotic-like serine/threonine-protein kinase
MVRGLLIAQRYELLEELGGGGMGAVWRAKDRKLNADVAVKLIDPRLADSTEALARFRREAEAAAAIRSTYVVQILDYGVDGDTPFIAMELLSGESLAQRLARTGKLSPEQAGRILGQVGRALALAHERQIVHRDLKPENIFLVREDDEDVAKVLDFGIARRSDSLGHSGGVKTRTGVLLGTPYYMSPEQSKGEPLDHRTDIWSFGAIAFECLTGLRPFEANSLAELFHLICLAPLPVPSQLLDVPAGFDAWFAQTASRDRSARFETIKEAADGLRTICGTRRASPKGPADTPSGGVPAATVISPVTRAGRHFLSRSAMSGLSVAAREETDPPSKRRILWLVAAATAAPLVLAVVGYSFSHRDEPSETIPSSVVGDSSAPLRKSAAIAVATNAVPSALVEPADTAPTASAASSRAAQSLRPAARPRPNPTSSRAPEVGRPPVAKPRDVDNAAGI